MPNHPATNLPTAAIDVSFQVHAKQELGEPLYGFYEVFRRKGSQPFKVADVAAKRNLHHHVLRNAIYWLCAKGYMRIQVAGEYVVICWLKSEPNEQPPEVSHES